MSIGFDSWDGWAHGVWERQVVPHAYCGDGSPYAIYLRRGDSKKLFFFFMAGGACWDEDSCYGVTRKAYLRPIPGVLHPTGILSSRIEESPVAQHTQIYLPYCTGDVFLGRHRARYGRHDAAHLGWLNLAQVWETVRLDPRVPHAPEEVVVYGGSAGAIGAILHTLEIDRLFGGAARKVLIADAPGLHFGPEFWSKFSSALIEDYSAALGLLGHSLERNDGHLARVVPLLCQRLSDWTVGVLQGSRDWVMARLFGERSLEEHERAVYGPQGVFALTQNPKDRCAAWVPSTEQHLFLMSVNGDGVRAGPLSALEFVKKLLQASSERGELELPSYR